ncbi:MAG: 50S ribosomal protein L37ae [Candidatus Woesearchaeota archaeon]
MRTKKLGSVARFGARYGRKPKAKILAVEKVQRKAQKCPYCSKPTAKRLAPGIWQCKKCNAKFTGKAYKVK